MLSFRKGATVVQCDHLLFQRTRNFTDATEQRFCCLCRDSLRRFRDFFNGQSSLPSHVQHRNRGVPHGPPMIEVESLVDRDNR